MGQQHRRRRRETAAAPAGRSALVAVAVAVAPAATAPSAAPARPCGLPRPDRRDGERTLDELDPLWLAQLRQLHVCVWLLPLNPSNRHLRSVGHVCRTPYVRTAVVPEAADGQSAGFGPVASAACCGSRSGRTRPEHHGQQRLATVSRRCRSAAASKRSPRSPDDPDCLSHGRRRLELDPACRRWLDWRA